MHTYAFTGTDKEMKKLPRSAEKNTHTHTHTWVGLVQLELYLRFQVSTIITCTVTSEVNKGRNIIIYLQLRMSLIIMRSINQNIVHLCTSYNFSTTFLPIFLLQRWEKLSTGIWIMKIFNWSRCNIKNWAFYQAWKHQPSPRIQCKFVQRNFPRSTSNLHRKSIISSTWLK